jgi:hypothetical protein
MMHLTIILLMHAWGQKNVCKNTSCSGRPLASTQCPSSGRAGHYVSRANQLFVSDPFRTAACFAFAPLVLLLLRSLPKSRGRICCTLPGYGPGVCGIFGYPSPSLSCMGAPLGKDRQVVLWTGSWLSQYLAFGAGTPSCGQRCSRKMLRELNPRLAEPYL